MGDGRIEIEGGGGELLSGTVELSSVLPAALAEDDSCGAAAAVATGWSVRRKMLETVHTPSIKKMANRAQRVNS